MGHKGQGVGVGQSACAMSAEALSSPQEGSWDPMGQRLGPVSRCVKGLGGLPSQGLRGIAALCDGRGTPGAPPCSVTCPV